MGLALDKAMRAELGTWRAFDLCPVVAVTFKEEDKRFMYNTVPAVKS